MTKLTNEELQFRKKPVVIGAARFLPDTKQLPFANEGVCCLDSEGWYISTLEGRMTLSEGDWVIRGIKGEFYPCKPEIFALTYEKLAEEAAGEASPLDYRAIANELAEGVLEKTPRMNNLATWPGTITIAAAIMEGMKRVSGSASTAGPRPDARPERMEDIKDYAIYHDGDWLQPLADFLDKYDQDWLKIFAGAPAESTKEETK